ncbi:MAG: enoyl-CoA hydratase/isomerase family protein [Betaproteobacteria bacterium]|nr:enoyl-CoA hydratase/isomerase family protein [Betaproteobacteria bacterium]
MSDILIDRSRAETAVVTINRPQRKNACDMAAWTDMLNVFTVLSKDSGVRLAILTGAGNDFCAGDDIVAFRAIKDDAAAADAQRKRIQECYAALQDAPFPIVAAIRGVCVGGGCSLAMCCDFRIADATARIGVPVAKLGLVYPTIQLQRLVALIGAQEARRWIYTGELVGAAEAHRAGFLDSLAESDPVEAALAFGATMMSGAPLSIAGSKAQLNAICAGQAAEKQAELDAMMVRADHSEDFDEAARAFAGKRKPRFRGR